MCLNISMPWVTANILERRLYRRPGDDLRVSNLSCCLYPDARHARTYPVDLTTSFGAEASASRGSGQVRELRETLNLPQGGAFGLFRHSQAFVGLRTSPLLPHRRSDNEILTA